jgi:hypothetical protein
LRGKASKVGWGWWNVPRLTADLRQGMETWNRIGAQSHIVILISLQVHGETARQCLFGGKRVADFGTSNNITTSAFFVIV